MQQGRELSPKSKNEFLWKQKGGPFTGRLCKEAKEEGKISQGRRCTMQSKLAPRHTD
jgi:hypothetical protein